MIGTEPEISKLRETLDRDLAETDLAEFDALADMRAQMGLAPQERTSSLQSQIELVQQMRTQFGRSDNPEGGPA